MQSFNRVILVGRLVADPEVKMTPSGVSVLRFRIAVDRRGKSSDEKVTDFFDVFSFRESVVNFVSSYIGKGRLVLVEGELRANRWRTPEGITRTKYEIMAINVTPMDRRPQSEETYDELSEELKEEYLTEEFREEDLTEEGEVVDLNEDFYGEEESEDKDLDQPPF